MANQRETFLFEKEVILHKFVINFVQHLVSALLESKTLSVQPPPTKLNSDYFGKQKTYSNICCKLLRDVNKTEDVTSLQLSLEALLSSAKVSYSTHSLPTAKRDIISSAEENGKSGT